MPGQKREARLRARCPGIHVFAAAQRKAYKPGHDELQLSLGGERSTHAVLARLDRPHRANLIYIKVPLHLPAILKSAMQQT
jgi:hypothetical protein